MKAKHRVVSLITVLTFAFALLAPVAYADSFKNLKRLGRGLEKAGRSAMSGRHNDNFGAIAGQLLGNSKGRNADLGQMLLNNLGGSRRHGGGDWGHYGAYRSEDATARAIRDVGLANAMVNLVGVIATTATQQNPYGVPAYGVPAYRTSAYGTPVYGAPSPMMQAPVAPPAPSGHYVREKVLVSGPHYVQVQEWVPELFDPRSGQKIGGGYSETRTRLVPETFEYRDVWVESSPGQW